MKKAFIVFVFLFSSILAFTQEANKDTTYWKRGGLFSLSFSQVSLSNWAAGGENSIAGNSLFSLFYNYKRDKISWDNSLELGYGLLRSGKNDVIKSDDRIDLTSKWGRKGGEKWYYSLLGNFKSQFAPGYNFPNDSVIVSRFMAPGYLLLAAGIDFKEEDLLSFFVSPLTGKFTFVTYQPLANAGAYGVDPATYDAFGNIEKKGENFRKEFGAYAAIKYRYKILPGIDFNTKVELFSNYLHNPQNIDVNWDALLAMKIHKFLTASISTTLIYDDDIDIPSYETIGGVKTVVGSGPKTQFKEVLGLGLSFKF